MKKDPSKLYLIHGLRGKLWFCETDSQIYLGNGAAKTFETKKEAREFMKTKEFKFLDELIPCEWHITTIEEWDKIF